MKTLLVIIDGAADVADASTEGLTPLQAADMPVADTIACRSATGRLTTSPDGNAPGSETAIMSILGYGNDRPISGRGWLEALGLGMEVSPDDTVWRCNVVRAMPSGRVVDPMPEDITASEACRLIKSAVNYSPIVDARHIGGLSGIVVTSGTSPEIDGIVSPYDAYISGTALRPVFGLPDWMWLWSAGHPLSLPPLPYRAALIAATPLVKGIGKALGMDCLDVPGATGDCSTSLEAKAAVAVGALDSDGYDFVMVHIEGADTASHTGSFRLKRSFLEAIDSRLLAPLWQRVSDGGDTVFALLPDHATSWRHRRHTSDPVPVSLYVPWEKGDNVDRFDETAVTCGLLGVIPAGGLAGIIAGLRKHKKSVQS